MWLSRLATLSNWLAQMRAVRLGLGERLGEALGIVHVVVGVLVGHRRHLDELGAEQPQRVLLLLGLRVGNDDHGAQAQRVADHGQADAGVAGRALDHRAAGPQRAASRRRPDDVQRGPVLDRLRRGS